jgi:hypothetical protein
LACGFRGFSPRIGWNHCFRPQARPISLKQECVVEDVYLLMVKKQSHWKSQDILFRGMPPNDLLPTGPTSYFLPPLNNAIILWIHQGINPLMKSESSGSNYSPKAPPLHIAAFENEPSTHEPLEGEALYIQTITMPFTLLSWF